MLDPDITEERREQITAEARKRIESGGSLKQDTTWGMRKLAYEIEQRTEADYRLFRFETDGGLLDDLNHNLRIADGVLRFRIFKVDPRSPEIVPPAPTGATAAADELSMNALAPANAAASAARWASVRATNSMPRSIPSARKPSNAGSEMATNTIADPRSLRNVLPPRISFASLTVPCCASGHPSNPTCSALPWAAWAASRWRRRAAASR